MRKTELEEPTRIEREIIPVLSREDLEPAEEALHKVILAETVENRV